jgi:hypothetical protein
LKVKFLKTALYALDPARGPYVKCVEGETADLPDADAKKLIDVKWAIAVVKPIVKTIDEQGPVKEKPKKRGRKKKND